MGDRAVDELRKDMDGGNTIERINAMVREETPPDLGLAENCDLNVNGYTLADATLGHRVLLTNGLAGVIRFVGPVAFDEAVWLGIDMKRRNCNGSDGCVAGRRYFVPKQQCGYWARMNEIERILPPKKKA